MFDKFSVQNTNVAKGIALLFLLWHHLFYQNEGALWNDYFQYHSIGLINLSGRIAVVCVAIFIFLSAVGLTKSLEGKMLDIRLFYKKHFAKIFFNYWFVWIIFVPIGVFVFHITLTDVYGNQHTLWYWILNILGQSANFNTPDYNPTWWFIAAITTLYLLYPLLVYIHTYIHTYIAFAVIYLLGFITIPNICGVNFWTPIQSYLPTFYLGMILADSKMEIKKSPRNIALTIFAIVLLLGMRNFIPIIGYTHLDTFIALLIVLLSFWVIKPVSFLGKWLEKLGKYSMDIFLFHTFLYYFWFPDIVYWSRDPVISFLTLLIMSVSVAWMLDKIRDIIHFDKLFILVK